MKRLPQRDPVAAHEREVIAARRTPVGAKCKCGESRPLALVPKSNPVICANCDRLKRGKATTDRHHVAGRANDSTTISVPVNDHRAALSSAQHDWPEETLENPNGSPVLRAAACIRGFIDTVFYLIEKHLLWIPEMLECLDEFLTKTVGRRYWERTELAQFAPKRKG